MTDPTGGLRAVPDPKASAEASAEVFAQANAPVSPASDGLEKRLDALEGGLRDVAALEPAERGSAFDEQRRRFGLRREFSALRVASAPDDAACDDGVDCTELKGPPWM